MLAVEDSSEEGQEAAEDGGDNLISAAGRTVGVIRSTREHRLPSAGLSPYLRHRHSARNAAHVLASLYPSVAPHCGPLFAPAEITEMLDICQA